MPGAKPSEHEADHYATLNVEENATAREIRAAFKRLMLEAHPDKNPKRQEWSERRVRELIAAFEVLGTEKARAEFDLRRSAARASRDRRRSTLKRADQPFFFRKKDPESRALLILHHLTHRHPRTAVELLEIMEREFGKGFLREHLERQDYLDALFLLAEHYTSRRKYAQAAGHLQSFYTEESAARFPRHYLPEVVRLLKDLYLRKIPGSSASPEALRALQAASDLQLTRSEEAQRLRKLAEVHLARGELDLARKALEGAERLYPLSPSAERIRKKIEAAR